MPASAENAAYATAPARSKNRDALNATIGKLTEKKSTETWVKELNEAGVPWQSTSNGQVVFTDWLLFDLPLSRSAVT